MTLRAIAAAAEPRPEINTDALDAIRSDLTHLHHLLDAAVASLMDAPRPPEMIGQLDRLGAFIWIARDMAQAAELNLKEALS
jgi:hypothetical protein